MSDIFTIPPGGDFLGCLAETLWERAEHSPLKLSEALVLLPTRRACRHLQDKFLKIASVSLLPKMQPLGDIDEDEFYFSSLIDIETPPAIAPLRRLMLLAQLVQKKDASLSFDQATLLAEALARFLDEAQTARCDMTKDNLHKLVLEKDLAQHWQQTVQFLEILTEAWPPLLTSEGCIDPAQRRDLILKKQAEAWKEKPPNYPIIAAGSTGSMPATADLLAVIAGLPKGAVILPGLDQDMAEENWQAIEETHPQYAMKTLLAHMKADRRDVKLWGKTTIDKNRHARIRLLCDAMDGAAAKSSSEKIHGLSRITLDHAQEEAQAIALMLREALENPDNTAALVTPDRALAARVVELLARWKIKVNDSAGSPLLAQPPGGFLAALLSASSPNATPTDYLALLKHPLAACGLDPAECRSRARTLELQVWRARNPEKSPWFSEIKKLLTPLASSWNKKLSLADRIALHIKTAEAFAKSESDSEEGAARLWVHDAGRETFKWLEEWREAAKGFPVLTGGDYTALFEELLRATPFRVPYGLHPRLSILGPLEARLLHYDLVILGGLNEGTWPSDAGIDPWMSRPMRKSFGLPSPERRIGQAAHDFVGLASSRMAVLTRSRRSGTSLAVPSRFLLQLEASLRAQGYADTALDPAQPYALWAKALDAPAAGDIKPCAPPLPKPSADARPKQLSVTEISTLKRNPYAIYARRILKLEKLEPLEQDIDASDKGALVHAALEEFTKKFPVLPENAEAELLKIGRGVFKQLDDHPDIFAIWWPLFERVAAWFIAYETARAEAGIKPVAAEATGKIKLGDFTLKGRADRIDRLSSGAYAITDYKTGGAPTNKEVTSGLEPQLPLLALIAKEGGFEGIAAAHVAALSYLKLTGGRVPGEEEPIKADIETLTNDARAGLIRLIEKFADANEPYRAVPDANLAPRYDDYAHLARLAEWGRTERDK